MDISDSDWAALAAIKTGKVPSKAVIQRLSEIRYVTITPRGDLRVTGLGNDALTLHRHGFKAPVEVEADEEPEASDMLPDDEDLPDAEAPDSTLTD